MTPENETALRQRIAELEEENQRLTAQQTITQSILDTSSSIIYAKDAQGRYLLVNRQTAQVLGQTPAAILGQTDADLLPPDLAAQFQDGDRTVLSTAQPLEREEVLPLGDTPTTYLAQSFPICDAQGTPYAVGGIATNITRLKHAEQQLRQSETQNRALLDSIPDLMFRLNREGVFLDYKDDKNQNLAMPPEAFLGKQIQELLPPDLATATLERVAWDLDTRTMQTYEYTIEVHGTTRFFEARYSTCGDQEVIAIIRDVTDLKTAEAERLDYQQQIIAAQQAAIRELSTPLIPLSPTVVLMPLVGSIDSNRAQMVLETLLEGIAAYQAETAILDITGVSVVDTQVANALIQAAQAVRLLGARVVLTGIGPAMAQTLVHLGADLSSIITRGSLQSAVAEALEGSRR
jgi:rsbT co-antagonist protein RsbR